MHKSYIIYERSRPLLSPFEFGLTITAYGVVSVFAPMVFIIVVTEVLKRTVKMQELIPEKAMLPVEPKTESEGIDEEAVALIAAVASYMTEVQKPSPIIEIVKTSKPSLWSTIGRTEMMRKRR
jgi:hypothetical protein